MHAAAPRTGAIGAAARGMRRWSAARRPPFPSRFLCRPGARSGRVGWAVAACVRACMREKWGWAHCSACCVRAQPWMRGHGREGVAGALHWWRSATLRNRVLRPCAAVNAVLTRNAATGVHARSQSETLRAWTHPPGIVGGTRGGATCAAPLGRVLFLCVSLSRCARARLGARFPCTTAVLTLVVVVSCAVCCPFFLYRRLSRQTLAQDLC